MNNINSGREFKVRGLGEIAIRCNDLESMSLFYENIIGLEPLKGAHREGILFFKVSQGYCGHTAVLALFQSDRNDSLKPLSSSLHHLALSLPYKEQEAVMDWYKLNNIEFEVRHFNWIGWRGIFTTDPEGNSVEMVAYHQKLLENDVCNDT